MRRTFNLAPALRSLHAELRASPGLQLLTSIVWAAGIATLSGFHVNVTRSFPLGLYFWDRSAMVEREATVLACLPQEWGRFAREREILGPGYCAGRARPIGKRVLALSGDIVELGLDGISVNGVAVPNSRVRQRDRRGRPMPYHPWGRYTMGAGDVWLYSPYHPDSFDSRYYGPLPLSSVRAVARPVWTSGPVRRRLHNARNISVAKQNGCSSDPS